MLIRLMQKPKTQFFTQLNGTGFKEFKEKHFDLCNDVEEKLDSMNNVQASSYAPVAEATDNTAGKEKTKALLTRQLKNETDSVKASINKFASKINDLEDKSIPSAQARYYRESMDTCAAKIEARIFELSTNLV